MDERNGDYETRPAENVAARSRNDGTVRGSHCLFTRACAMPISAPAVLKGANDQINLAEAVHCGCFFGCGSPGPFSGIIAVRMATKTRMIVSTVTTMPYRYRPYFSYPYPFPPPVH